MRHRTLFVVVALSVALSACMPGLSPVSAGDAQATAVALARTQAAQTLMALPSPTLPPSNTPLPTFTNTPAPTATNEPTNTATAAPETTGTAGVSPTSTGTGDVTGTAPSATVTSTTTVTTTITGTITATRTPTPGPLLWGTVPPEVPYAFITLKNLTNDMVYISFHCTLQSGLVSYLEFPVYSTLKVKIPSGPCHYVAWVKAQQFTGDVHLKKSEEYTFTFKPKKVIFTQP